MGQLLSFEDHALARLREQVAAAEEAREDLLAFARGQSGAVAAIHQAVLAAMEATDFDHLLHVVVQEWPLILGLDAVALGLIVGTGLPCRFERGAALRGGPAAPVAERR